MPHSSCPLPRHLLAALVIGLCGHGLAAPAAFAANAQAEQARHYQIPAAGLDHVLTRFAAQAGITLSIAAADIQGLQSPGLQGDYNLDQALRQLLADSGLVVEDRGNGNYLVRRAVSPTALDLGSVRVEGEWDPSRAIYQRPGPVAHLDHQQLQRLRQTSVGDIFKSTPGVIAANNHNGSSLDLNIRGLQGQNRVKVAIDGTQQSTTTWRGYNGVDERVYVDPDLIGGVDISKGPTAGAAGAGVIGGVVAMRTLEAGDILQPGKDQGVRLRLGTGDNARAPSAPATYQQRSEHSDLGHLENNWGSLAAALRQGNLELVLAASKRKTGNYFAGKHGKQFYSLGRYQYPLSFTQPEEEVFNSSEDTESLLLKSQYRLDEHLFKLGYMRYDGKFGEASQGTLLTQQDNGYRQLKLAKALTQTYTSGYHWNHSDLLDLKANLWRTEVDSTTRVAAAAPDFSQWGYIPADEPRKSHTVTHGLDLSNRSQLPLPIGALRLDYGASYSHEQVDDKDYISRTYTRDIGVRMPASRGNRSIARLHLESEWEMNPWLTLNLGLRHDSFKLKDKSNANIYHYDLPNTISGQRLNPAIGLTLSPLPGVQLYAQYNEGMRAPTLRESLSTDAPVKPNPNIKEEVAKNWELGINYLVDNLLFAQDSLGVKLGYFDNTYQNYIARVSHLAVGEPMFTFVNLDEVRFKGVELNTHYQSRYFIAQAGVSRYLDMAFCERGQSCQDLPVSQDYAINHIPPKLSAHLLLGLKLLDERLELNVSGHHSGRRMADLTQSDRSRTAYWEPYTLLDALVAYRLNDHLSVELKGENLENRYYVDAMDGWTPGPGRTLRASLTARF